VYHIDNQRLAVARLLGLLLCAGLASADDAEFERQRKLFPAETIHEHIMIPMRDGIKLATEVYRPPGTGTHPILLIRTPYSRFDKRVASGINQTPAPHYDFPFVAVCQNLRGVSDSEGPGRVDFIPEVEDSYDTIEWLAKQPWSNGRVVMTGASGSGVACAAAIFCKAPHLVAVFTHITGDDFSRHFGYYNCVKRYDYSWIEKLNRGKQPPEWPRPTTVPYNLAAREAFLTAAGKDNHVLAVFGTGWYDTQGEGAQDAFTALMPQGKIWGSISNGGHGPVGGRPMQKLKSSAGPPSLSSNDVMKVLKGDVKIPTESVVRYALMGDDLDPNAPGNVMMTTKVWPVPSTPTAYYLNANHTLTVQQPTDAVPALTYANDPRDPVKSIGGRYVQGDKQSGPMDQRPIKDRKDLLHFATGVLSEPVGITGTIAVDLAISTDVEDTLFVVNIVDIYPDGYEALIAGGPMMARYHQGFDKPAPIEKGKTYHLHFTLWGTAIVFNTGHRIGVYLSSSSDPAYEVHPNTFKPALSINDCKIANNTVHMSAAHASRIILPVIPKESYSK
ncbi:MAG: CocE/NonD family hydrolase, partial [Planctomycetota bacterium]